ncbi:NAD(P)-dependent oxidoreductase [Magnetospirillum sp. UT-4]|uniref:NAD-dependent epimerase/dehydratase family protein n=1 Tax=Magnetospirillum sp. UT-4 TaxID=2681467 RepID=UPI001572BC38|nr:NAD-dependent epimerase/dehydratase family protein [Magnetospirillum sp. UT-4]
MTAPSPFRSTPVAAVTGGTGFLGQAVVRRLRAEGWRVRVLARRAVDGALDVVPGAPDDQDALRRLLTGASLVVHVADPVAEPDVAGAAHIGTALRRSARGARLLVVSCLAARDPKISAYAGRSAEAETALIDAAGGDDWLVLRLAAIYGPGDSAILPLFRAARLPVLPIPARSRARLALLHVDDAVRAVLAAAHSTDRGRVWEVGEGAAGWAEIARAAARALGREPPVLPVPRPILAAALGLARLGGGKRVPAAAPGRLAELLHGDWSCRPDLLPPSGQWSPSIALAAGFAMTADWYRLHRWL